MQYINNAPLSDALIMGHGQGFRDGTSLIPN